MKKDELTNYGSIPIKITAQMGQTVIGLKDFKKLGEGSLLELDSLAGQPIELFANGKIFANAEVVVIDETFGVRITQGYTDEQMKEKAYLNHVVPLKKITHNQKH